MITHASSLSAQGLPSTGANLDREATQTTREKREISHKIQAPMNSQQIERAYVDKIIRIDIYA